MVIFFPPIIRLSVRTPIIFKNVGFFQEVLGLLELTPGPRSLELTADIMPPSFGFHWFFWGSGSKMASSLVVRQLVWRLGCSCQFPSWDSGLWEGISTKPRQNSTSCPVLIWPSSLMRSEKHSHVLSTVVLGYPLPEANTMQSIQGLNADTCCGINIIIVLATWNGQVLASNFRVIKSMLH